MIRYTYRIVPRGAPLDAAEASALAMPADLVLTRDDGDGEHEIARETYPTLTSAQYALQARVQEDDHAS